MATPVRKSKQQPETAAVVADALHAAEENERRGAAIIREREVSLAAAERVHAEAVADSIEGKLSAQLAAEKGAVVETARQELHAARQAHQILIQRRDAARHEHERIGKAEVLRAIQHKFDKRLRLARQYEALEKERGRIWTGLHEVAAEITVDITAVRPSAPVPAGCLLDKTSLRLAWESEAYRLNANPDQLGGMGLLRPGGPPTIPGARGGNLTLLLMPERLQSFVDAIAQANAFLLSTLDGSTPLVAADKTTANGASVPAVDSKPRSESDRKLGELLRKQAQLAENPAATDQEYQAVVLAIAELAPKTENPNA
jgi:hypothetical protein